MAREAPILLSSLPHLISVVNPFLSDEKKQQRL